MDSHFKNKYLKYKAKYMDLKKIAPTNIFGTQVGRKEVEDVITKVHLSMNKIKDIYQKYTSNNIQNEELKSTIEKLENTLQLKKKELLDTFHTIDEKSRKYAGIEAEIKRKQEAQSKDKKELDNLKALAKNHLASFKTIVSATATQVAQAEKKFKNIDEIIAKRNAQVNIASEKKTRRENISSEKKKSSPKANKVPNLVTPKVSSPTAPLRSPLVSNDPRNV